MHTSPAVFKQDCVNKISASFDVGYLANLMLWTFQLCVIADIMLSDVTA